MENLNNSQLHQGSAAGQRMEVEASLPPVKGPLVRFVEDNHAPKGALFEMKNSNFFTAIADRQQRLE